VKTIDTRRGRVTVTRTETHYVIAGPSGEHRLRIDRTNARRLDAHVAGFVAWNNRPDDS
jgi:hypothetical protein